jgi:hypothetical protein
MNDAVLYLWRFFEAEPWWPMAVVCLALLMAMPKAES